MTQTSGKFISYCCYKLMVSNHAGLIQTGKSRNAHKLSKTLMETLNPGRANKNNSPSQPWLPADIPDRKSVV